MAKVTEDQGSPGSEGEYTPLTTFVDANIGTTPNTTITTTANESEEKSIFESTWKPFDLGGTIETVTNSTKTTVKGVSKDDVLSATDLGKIKQLASDSINDPTAIGSMDAEFWKDVAKGDANLNDLTKLNNISKLANAISGTDCMPSSTIDKDLLNGLLDNVWDLMPGGGKFFDCLFEDLKGLGADLVNNIAKNALGIIKDDSMASLKACGDLLAGETKNCLPNYADSLESFSLDKTSSVSENGTFVDNTLSSIGGDKWFTDDTDGSIDLDLLGASSKDATTSLTSINNESIDTGFSLHGLFEESEESVNVLSEEANDTYNMI